MEDVFYFSRSEITLDDIAHIASGVGCCVSCGHTKRPREPLRLGYGPLKPREVVTVAADGTWQTHVEMRQDHLECAEWNDWNSLEPYDRAQVEAYDPRSSFRISLRTTGLPEARALLKKVLERYGGWVGADEAWDRTYDVETIDRLMLASDQA